MKKDVELVNKIKYFAKKAGIPRFLHHFGPKKYTTYIHLLALFIRQECKLGYRRVTKLLRLLGHKCPCPSALCMSNRRIPFLLMQKFHKLSIGVEIGIIAIDGTCLSRPLPSPYYYKRIDKPYPIDIPLKLSIAVDVNTRKIVALRFRAKKVHDIKDAKYLVRHLPNKPKMLIADKGYDANWFHEFCLEQGIETCIPIRNMGKETHCRRTTRKRQAEKFKKKVYGKRNIVESMIKSLNTKFGSSVSSVKFTAQRADIYCRAIAHNLMQDFYFIWTF
jgi:transposase